MAKILGYDVIYFNISNSTTVEDLFCKKMPVEKDGNMIFIDIRSLLLEGIDANVKKEKNCIIILDNIQLANTNVLESLIPLFDINIKSILVQGEEVIKRSYNLIGLFDSSMESKEINDFLPDAIKHSTILYKNSKYQKREYCLKIIEKMFGEEYNDENESKIEYYLNAFIKLNNYVIEKQIKELFTFNDFKKLLFFLKKSRTDELDPTSSIFDIQTITQLLLVYKFDKKEMINSANEILGNSLASDFWPIFSYLSDENKEDEMEEDEFQIAPDNKGENLSYPTKISKNKIQRKELLLKTHSLSPDQRRGIIFLMLSVLSDVPCVIQGVTASGKTHLIRLFCELLGIIPLIIDVNNDTGISVLLKQLVPKEELEIEKIKALKKKIKQLIKKEKKFSSEEIKKIINLDNSDEWVPSNFRNLLKLIEEKASEISNENILLVSDLKSLLKEQLSFFKHLSNEDSSFIKAMINGDWVILDGIESAQPELYQRLSSLCDLENQNLTMYDNGPEYVYTKNAENEKFKIHPNFRLFITYNPDEAEPSKKLPHSFLNKCLTFSLGSIDENIRTTSLVLSGVFLIEKLYRELEEEYYNKNKEKLHSQMPEMRKKEIINNILKEDLRILGIKFASIHHYSNELAIKNKEDFAGKKTFSGRSIKFILNSLKIRQKQLEEGIISVIQDIYCYPYKKSQKELKSSLINKFLETPNNELMQFLRNDEINVEEKYKSIKKDLISIEKNPEISFDMYEFIISTFVYIYKDIPYLIEELEKCLSTLNIENMNYTYISIFRTILNNYWQRKGNEKEISKSLTKKKIDDLDLAKEDEFLRIPQNLLFVYHSLLKKKLIKRIANLDYLTYSEILEKKEEENEEEENEEEKKEEKRKREKKEVKTEENESEDEEDPLILISKNEKQYIEEKKINGEKPYLELCLENSNYI
jgi:MoxR-like ATPase